MDSLFHRIRRLLRIDKRPQHDTRTIYIGNKLISNNEVEIPDQIYPDNRVISSKYTVWNFIPKNLFEQFQRIANFYFLIVGAIQFLIDTPVSPATSVLPLVFVVSVTTIKQGYEDWLRHKADDEVNNQQVNVIRNDQLIGIKSMNIKVGDIVHVEANSSFPCDMVMLSSHDPEGSCYITTANLDGETNLKTCACLPETRKYQTVEDIIKLNATLIYRQPVPDLYSFTGHMTIMKDDMEENCLSLNPTNILLRGARLRNTPYIFGCAVYTGQETKMALNSKFKSTKFSRIEKRMNLYLKVFLMILILEAVICTALKYWFNHFYTADMNIWYLDINMTVSATTVIQDLLAFLVILNYIIPISLYVTIEVQKFIGSMFIGWDKMMYDEKSDIPAKANTSDLNEELGQVEYLFTDKTGTLTENDMQFRECTIDGKCFLDYSNCLCEKPEICDVQPKPVLKLNEKAKEFFKVLALCHTVRVDHPRKTFGDVENIFCETGEKYDYQAASPDEKAFVEACRRYGIVYHGKYDNHLQITVNGELEKYKLLQCLDFDSTRKRMSVIVQDKNDQITLLCKGAECSIMDNVVSGDKHLIMQQITGYAMQGLRTLVIAKKPLTSQEYTQFKNQLREAKEDLFSQEEKLSVVYDNIETNLDLLGATAIEDRLQDGVPDTISALKDAGIKVWILTGDKEETAVNISYSAGHFQEGMTELRITQFRNTSDCDICGTMIQQHLQTISTDLQNLEKRIRYALIVDGSSLSLAIKYHSTPFLELCIQCASVLCCRLSPIQKAQVVRLIKTSKDHPVTAAIGDGANDVSMIQEADVGLGMAGKEGRQAVRCSDYAFARFKFLMPALLVHGHYFYIRLANLVQYFFYKNVAFITVQIYYACFSAFSQQSLYESFLLMFYNITFTSMPVLMYGLFERDIQQADLLERPHTYQKFIKNEKLSAANFLKWNTLGLWHSLVFFFGMYYLYGDGASLFDNAQQYGNWGFGFIVCLVCVITVNAKLALEVYSWSIFIVLAFLLTIIFFFAQVLFYNNFIWGNILDGDYLYMVVFTILSSASVWLATLILTIIALLPDFLIRLVQDTKYDSKFRKRKINFFENSKLTLISFTKRSGTLTVSQMNIIGD